MVVEVEIVMEVVLDKRTSTCGSGMDVPENMVVDLVVLDKRTRTCDGGVEVAETRWWWRSWRKWR